MNMSKVISLASIDIADSIVGGSSRNRRNSVKEFLEMALWSAASAAESLPSSAWIDSTKDDSWLRNADSEQYQFPSKLTDDQLGKLFRILNEDPDKAMAGTIPPRIKLDPALEDSIKEVVGPGTDQLSQPLPELDVPNERVDSPPPDAAMDIGKPKLDSKDIGPEPVDEVREGNYDRGNIKPPEDESEGFTGNDRRTI